MNEPGIENLLHEDRTFPPSEAFASRAHATPELYAEAEDDYVVVLDATGNRTPRLDHRTNRRTRRLEPSVLQVVHRR